MIDPEKIKKLILGSNEDRELANEFIKKYKLCVIPDEFKQSVWDLEGKYFTYYQTGSLYWRNMQDNTWYKLETTVTASTTTKI